MGMSQQIYPSFKVKNDKGTPLQGVKIEMKNISSKVLTSGVTNVNGFTYVDADGYGTYEVTITNEGYEKYVQNFEIKERSQRIEITLQPANTEQGCNFTERTLEFTVNGQSFRMILIDMGTFEMGNGSQNLPSHEVSLSCYYLGETEVTQALYNAVTGRNPSEIKGDNLPVNTVSYKEIVEVFLPKLNQLTGRNFKLPTEAQTEYACRGGDKGFDMGQLGNQEWFSSNSGYQLKPVRTKKPNNLGLYDMIGNVREWCRDYYGRVSSESQTNPTGVSSNEWGSRVVKGHHFGDMLTKDNLFTERNGEKEKSANSKIGFRLCLED